MAMGTGWQLPPRPAPPTRPTSEDMRSLNGAQRHGFIAAPGATASLIGVCTFMNRTKMNLGPNGVTYALHT